MCIYTHIYICLCISKINDSSDIRARREELGIFVNKSTCSVYDVLSVDFFFLFLILSCWMKWTIDVSFIQLIDGTVELNYVLIDCVPSGSVNFQHRGVEVLNYNSLFTCLSSQFYQFLPDILWCCKDHHSFLGYWFLYHYVMLLFILDTFSCSEAFHAWN